MDGEARNGWVGVYEHDEETVLEQPANPMIRSFIQTSTDLEQIVIADPEWNPMSDIDPISWQPDGIDYEVYHEASIDDGPGGEFITMLSGLGGSSIGWLSFHTKNRI